MTIEFSIGNKEQRIWYIYISLIFLGINTYTLTLALSHQSKYRSQWVNSTKSQQDKEYKLEQTTSFFTWIKYSLCKIEIIYFLALTIYLIALFTISTIQTPNPNIFVIAFIVIFSIQRVPYILILIFIIFGGKKDNGPNLLSKLILGVGALINVLNDLPITMWAELFQIKQCTFHFASSIDLLNVLYLIGQFLFYGFIVREYNRNKMEIVWGEIR